MDQPVSSEANGELKELFVGRKRLRLPGMHMITAEEGGMPFAEAFGAFVFGTAHDRLKHDCLIHKPAQGVDRWTRETLHRVQSPEAMMLTSVLDAQVSVGLAFQEWSYLPEATAKIFVDLAQQIGRWTQLKLALGDIDVRIIPLGPLVSIPAWTRTMEARHWLRSQPNPNPFDVPGNGYWTALEILAFSHLYPLLSISVYSTASVPTQTEIQRAYARLSDADRAIFSISVGMIHEMVQRWTSSGIETPVMTAQGPLVEQPDWAKKYYGDARNAAGSVAENRAYVATLREEIAKDALDPAKV